MEDSCRFQKVGWLTILVMMAPVLGCSQSGMLTELDTHSDYCSYGYYNEWFDKLVYFGVLVDSDEKITGSTISIRDITNGQEQIVEKNIGYPAIGWVNDSTVLVFKILMDPSKPILSPDHERLLYTFNAFTNKQEPIVDIPLKESGSNLVVDSNVIIYQTRFRTSTKLFKYNLVTKETSELELASGLNLGYGSFAYDGANDRLAFVVFEKDRSSLMLLSKNSLRTIEVADKLIANVSFHKSDNRLYFTVQQGKYERYILKSVNLDNLKIDTHYRFDEQVEPIAIAPYKKKSLLVTLDLPANHTLSKHEFKSKNATTTLEINPRRKIFILEMN